MIKSKREVEFNVSAYTARLIGRENVSKIEGAVFELVKNAYDADAKKVCLYYDNEGKILYIIDNGTGMKEQIIIDHWMTIGNSSKKTNYISDGNRIQTGAKGIGRFALDRLSDKCHMLTITENSALEWIVNWADFAEARNISDVKAVLADSSESIIEFTHMANWKNQRLAKILLKKQKDNDFYSTGTVFCLSALRDDWDADMIKKVRTHLENLLPPDISEQFEIYLFDNETEPETAKIESKAVDYFDYKISFSIAEDSPEKINLAILRNEVDLGENEDEFIEKGIFTKQDREYFHGKAIEKELQFKECTDVGDGKNIIGSFSGCLYFNKATVHKADAEKYFYKDITGRKNFEKEFGGIKIYRDYFRVRPYGEYGSSDFDWLQLSARRNRQPAAISHKTGRWRVGADQMMGVIKISRENQQLEDDANRNGIQSGPGLEQLKDVIIAVINEFEKDRQYVGRILFSYDEEQKKLQQQLEKLREQAELRRQWEEDQKKKQEEQEGQEDQKKEENETEPAEKHTPQEELKESDDAGPYAVSPVDAAALIEQLTEQKDQEIQDLRDEMKMLKTLATTGIITNMFMHEIRTLTTNIGLELDAAYDYLEFDKDWENGLRHVKFAIAHKKNFASWFRVTIDSIKKDKRKRKKCQIDHILKDFIKTWKYILEKNGIKINYDCEPDIMFRCFTFDIENIISNLIANSLYSFDKESEHILEKKEINIKIRRGGKGFVLEYSDTGWGLSDKYKEKPERILEAFETDKKGTTPDDEGTGMGMWIVNSTVMEYNGSINLSKNKNSKNGFYLTLQLGGYDV